MAYSASPTFHFAASLGSNGGTTAAHTSSGDILFVTVSAESTVTATLSDSKSNSYTKLTGVATGIHADVYYCQNPTVGASHTWTVSSTGGFNAIAVAGFTGSATTPLDQQNHVATTNAFTLQPGSVTPGQANEIVVTGLCYNTTKTITIDSSFTITDTQDFVTSTSYGVSMAYLVQTTATAENPQWSLAGGTSQNCQACIGTFKAAAGGGNSPGRGANPGKGGGHKGGPGSASAQFGPTLSISWGDVNFMGGN